MSRLLPVRYEMNAALVFTKEALHAADLSFAEWLFYPLMVVPEFDVEVYIERRPWLSEEDRQRLRSSEGLSVGTAEVVAPCVSFWCF